LIARAFLEVEVLEEVHSEKPVEPFVIEIEYVDHEVRGRNSERRELRD
jgi:hypothetical protein